MIQIHSVFDPATSTLTHLVWQGRDAVVIDPVLDYDSSAATATTSPDKIQRLVDRLRLTVHWILETHAHADHLSSARELRSMLPGARWAMSERLREVFNTFKREYSWPDTLRLEDLGVDRWLNDGEEFFAGAMRIGVLATPGHTPADVTYRIGDHLFVGDTLMMPDTGTGRCDFPGGSADTLYRSVWGKLYSLPDSLRVHVGHDYQPGGRHLRSHASLGEHKQGNAHLRLGTSRADFVRFREGRDASLKAPKLIEPALDWNLGAHVRTKRA